MRHVFLLVPLLGCAEFGEVPSGDTDEGSSSTADEVTTIPFLSTSSSGTGSGSASASSTSEGSSEDSSESGTTEEESSSSSGSTGEVVVNHALRFEGSQKGVTDDLPGLPSEYTIELFVRTMGQLHGTILSSAGGNPPHGVFFYHAEGEWTAHDNRLTFIDYDAPAPGWDYVVDPDLNLNDVVGWHHVAVTKDATGLISLFLDGGRIAQRQFGAPFDDAMRPLKLGVDGGEIVPLDGALLDELRISDVVRYEETYDVPQPLEADEDTVYLWHFDEGEGEEAVDEVAGVTFELTDPIWFEHE